MLPSPFSSSLPSLNKFSRIRLQKCNFNPFHHCLPHWFPLVKAMVALLWSTSKIRSRSPFPSCTTPISPKPLLCQAPFSVMCPYICPYRPWNALSDEISPLQDTNVTSSSFLSLSTWSCYLLIICKPLLCTPSCPVSFTSEMGLVNPLKADTPSCTSFQPYQWCSGLTVHTCWMTLWIYVIHPELEGRCWNISALEIPTWAVGEWFLKGRKRLKPWVLSMDRIRVKYEYTQLGKELDRLLGELSLCSTFTAQPQLLPGRQSVHTTPHLPGACISPESRASAYHALKISHKQSMTSLMVG